ncbi:MAG TPA: phosphatase PAP2 family protein [Gemmatimonadaceae bacterium]|nr:phosphatase PAP2 family protein [Gemmatimonadaceae bacterium]
MASTVLVGRSAVAQTRPVTDTIPASRDALIGLAFMGTAAAMGPFDGRIAVAAQQPSVQRSTILRGGSRVFNALGDPGTVVLSLGAYGVGWITHNRDIAAIGLHATQAIGVSFIAGEMMKGVVGRARPFVNIHDSDDFYWGRGFGSARESSFPSGHAYAAFALASVLSAETSHRWPHAVKWVAPLAYTLATCVGLARIQTNQHWASDVIAGAGLGTASGLLVVHFNEAHDDNFLERTFLPSP